MLLGPALFPYRHHLVAFADSCSSACPLPVSLCAGFLSASCFRSPEPQGLCMCCLGALSHPFS